jgi:ribosomal 50S subunit-associated protein YjgA (DUF615 family)
VPKWNDPPSDEPQDDASDLRSRTDARKERLAREELLMQLSEALASSNSAVLAKLNLPESLMDAIRDTQAIRPGAARNRSLRLVRSALRNEDFEAIRQRFGSVHGNSVSLARQRQRERR